MWNIKFFCVVFSLFFLLTMHTDSYAAYTGNPSRIFTSEDNPRPFSLYVEGITDIVYDRCAKHQTDDMEVNFYGGALGIIYENWCALYGGAGTAIVEETFTVRNRKITWESDYTFSWLAGGTFKLYEKSLQNFYESRLLVSLDMQYRGTDVDVDTITIDSVEYDASHADISHSSMEYNDWHVAFICGLEIGMFSPYVGAKYSDFESCVRVTQGGTIYQKDNAEADNNFGVLVGTGVEVADSLFANIEAGFIDEDSISCSVSWRF